MQHVPNSFDNPFLRLVYLWCSLQIWMRMKKWFLILIQIILSGENLAFAIDILYRSCLGNISGEQTKHTILYIIGQILSLVLNYR